MRYKLFLIMFMLLAIFSCEHKELSLEDPCGNNPIKVVVHWEDMPSEARSMRINLFSQTPKVNDYGRDEVPATGVKYIDLERGASYLPYCYDYNAPHIYFRNELGLEVFEAYFSGMSRGTFNDYSSVPGIDEPTYSAPTNGVFYAHAWTETFDVHAKPQGEQVIDFYPRNILREFTYRINTVNGAENLKDIRGAISGMAAAYTFHTAQSTEIRSTLFFSNVRKGYDAEKESGYLEGEFYTFPPLAPYRNVFTIELYTTANSYFFTFWNVSEQVEESMADRPAKLARDGYDILIDNDPGDGIPNIDPGEPEDGGGGFEIDVGEWGDEVIVELK